MDDIQPVPVGTLEKEPRYVLRVHVGEASIVLDGKEYTLDISVAPNNSPIISCKETGLLYSLSWQDIVKIAVSAWIAGQQAN